MDLTGQAGRVREEVRPGPGRFVAARIGNTAFISLEKKSPGKALAKKHGWRLFILAPVFPGWFQDHGPAPALG